MVKLTLPPIPAEVRHLELVELRVAGAVESAVQTNDLLDKPMVTTRLRVVPSICLDTKVPQPEDHNLVLLAQLPDEQLDVESLRVGGDDLTDGEHFGLFLYKLPPPTNIDVQFTQVEVFNDAFAFGAGDWTLNADVNGTGVNLLTQEVNTGDILPIPPADQRNRLLCVQHARLLPLVARGANLRSAPAAASARIEGPGSRAAMSMARELRPTIDFLLPDRRISSGTADETVFCKTRSVALGVPRS